MSYLIWNEKSLDSITYYNQNNNIFERDNSRNSGDMLAKHLLNLIKDQNYPSKDLYDLVADYAESEQHSNLLLKLGLVEPEECMDKNDAIKNLTKLKVVNKPIEYENNLGKRKLICQK